MATVGAIFLALLKFVPIVDEWAKSLFLVYLKWKHKDMEEDDVAAVHKLLTTGDQRDFEKLLGYTRAGQPSGLPGAVIVPSLPGLPGDPDQKKS